jgi:ABC-type multidrug transport system fused ATPase/permease subunit
MHDRSLASWFAVWHPAYRRQLFATAVLALVAGVTVFLENRTLREITKAFDPSALKDDNLLRWFASLATATGLALPMVVLATFALLRLTRTAADFGSRRLTVELNHRAKSDLEAQLLDHLLRKDDAFFATRQANDMLQRLSTDIGRIVDRRSHVNAQRASVFTIIGNVYFFWSEDWRLAVAAVVTCFAGAWAMYRLTLPVKDMDHRHGLRDDRVKESFDDFLRASPEVQVSGLRPAVRSRFAGVQQDRADVFLRLNTFSARLSVAQNVSFLLAFIALVMIANHIASNAPKPTEAIAGLVPVILKALPELFREASQIVQHRLNLQFADVSAQRLLEYEAGTLEAATEKKSPAPAISLGSALRVDGVTYRYRSEEGASPGGVADVTMELPVDRWTAVVGPAGSGKSTLVHLIVGRTRAHAGAVRIDDTAFADLDPIDRARVITLLPQTPAILDASIAENLAFGRDREEAKLDDDDLDIIERLGLGAICRAKALTMMPSEANGGALVEKIVEIRQKVRGKLGAVGLDVRPYDEGARDPDDTVIERLAGVRADRPRMLETLFGTHAKSTLDELAASELGTTLADGVRRMLDETRALLSLPSYAEYAALAPAPIDERVWNRRVQVIALAKAAGRSRVVMRDLLLVALTAKVREFGVPPEPNKAITSAMKRLLAEVSVPFDSKKTHPYLVWRDNTVFGQVDATNSRAESRVDQLVLDTLVNEGHSKDLVRIGLSFAVGRGGSRLTNAQRQLVAVTRAVLRRTPVLVMDDPTSALDPPTRKRVATFLRDWKRERVVVTVSHDADFVKAADTVRVLDGGRLVGEGSFADVEREPTVRRALKL